MARNAWSVFGLWRCTMRSTLLAGCACLIAPMTPLQAQDTPAAQEEPDISTHDIIVTARKREESALEVPVIQTVLTADTIQRASITSIDDIARFAPGLQVGESVLSIGTQVSLRGIGTSAFDPGVDQSVSLNIDGLSFSQGLAFQSGTFDLAQIEVLKGPQALFFGKSSPGGVISIRTADPGDELEVIVRSAHEFEANEYRGELILSAPITDTLGIRLAGMGYDGDGYFRNRALGLAGTGAKRPDNRLGGGDGFQLRGTVKFEPSDVFDARLKVNHVEDTTEYPGAVQLASCPEGTTPSAGNPFPRPIDPNEDCQLDRTIYLVDLDPAAFPLVTRGGRQFNDKQQTYGTLEMNLTPVERLTLTSVTGYYDLGSTTQFNTFQTGYAGPGLAHKSFYDRKEFTQEVRANSDFAGPLNFTVGAFYQDADVSLLQPVYGNRTVLPASRTVLSQRVNDLDIESWSVFGQLRYRPVEALELAVGGRYTDEKRSDEVFDFLTNALVPLAVPEIDSQTFSPEATVTYTPTDDLTLFASYKKGYKSGSFTTGQLPPPPRPGELPDNSFGDEKIEGGEAGVKARLFDRQVTANLAGYYYDVTGLQVGANEADGPGDLPVTRTVNAGAGRIYGADFEISWWPRDLEGFNLHAGVAWNKSKFTELDTVPCYGGQTIALGCTVAQNPVTGFFTAQNLNGIPFLRAPEWQATFGAVYEIPLPDGWSLTLAYDNHYASRYLTALGRRADFWQDDYLKVDVSVALAGPDDRWELALIGKNVTDQVTAGNCVTLNAANSFFLTRQTTGSTTSGPDGVDEVGCLADSGRSIWVRLTLRPFK